MHTNRYIFLGLLIFFFSANDVVQAAEKTPAYQCQLDIDALLEIFSPGQIVMFGEMHGTQETPQFVTELACLLVKNKLPVRIGLEIPNIYQPQITDFMKTKNRNQLLKMSFWKDGRDYGLGSQAIVDLLDRLATLRRMGADIRVFAYDKSKKDGSKNRDMVMAENILKRQKADQKSIFLVLAGNYHTRTVKGAPFDSEYKPMGYWISKKHSNILSLVARYPSGTWWGTSAEEGEKPKTGIQKYSTEKKYARYAILPYKKPDDHGYQGDFTLPSMTASPPALSIPTKDPSRSQL